MSNQRKLVFVNGGYYHVFNRGIDRRITFHDKREYSRAMNLLSFYQYNNIPTRYSQFSILSEEIQRKRFETMVASGKIVDVIAYCLMPNHFHLLLKQTKEKGIATYTANFMNAYTKYFNTKHERTGPLFQGIFKAIYVETDEQLTHLTRYIHLNPVTSSLIKPEQLDTFPWSSYHAYKKNSKDDLVSHETITSIRTLAPNYENFVKDQISYAKELDKIKHLTFE
ncbi:MAG TPA: transposase [Patescibacteria group bacterium]|nr:transposase [Patescibacteria group bacterium]